MKIRLLITTIALFSLLSLPAQTLQKIKGQILDKQSEMSIIGATVIIKGSDPLIGTTTDLDGYFTIEDVAIGRYDLHISFIGYEGTTIPNVEVKSGKEVFLNVALQESVESLDEVVITAKTEKDRAQNEMATVSARTFSVEEVNRYSGGRSDIARLAANFAGVSSADDARNDIVIRGNSPTGVLWRLEGVPIPNPNHFSTLGTTGGPVSAMNPNLIKNSDFLTSAFPAEYGNALAGVFDLSFRNGNKDKNEYMFQLGAVSGFEGMVEGPLNKKSNGSYVVAGRYSFVGLAGNLGLPIGTNATPNYQDVSYNIDLGKTSLGKISFFGILTNSDIDFLRDEVDEDDLFAADDEDSFAESNLGVFGIKQNILLDQKTYLRNIVSFSTSANQFYADRYTSVDSLDESKRRYFENDNTINTYTLSSFINRKFNAKFNARSGFIIEYSDYDVLSRTREFTPDWIESYSFDDQAILFQAYYQSQYRFSNRWSLNTGIHTQVLDLNDNWTFEPRLALNYDLNKANRLTLGYGIHAQVAPLPILLLKEEVSEGVYEETNVNLEPSRSQHFVLGYDLRLAADWRIKTELYYQYLDNVPVDPVPSSFSLLNQGEDFAFPDDKFGLVNEGTGTNYGFEFTLEKFFSDGFYGLFTTSLYESKFKGSDGIERNSAFNNNYVINLLAGREFDLGSSGKYKFTMDTKFTTAGGRYYTPIDLEASQLAGEQVLDEENAYTERYDPYIRWDLKFGMKINSQKKQVTHHFFFDIQNVTNNENIFVNRYNRLTNEINEVNQIGFFPDFMYRIQF